jgi:2-polyprenyl-3-methyl-5-hydroxy-6-metoxy-1,4-benzoquinol methylase
VGARELTARGPAHERFLRLAPDAPRAEYFAALREAIAEHYLAEPGNAYRESGRSSGAARWEETRACFADAVERDGDFMDVGCANGLLLETLARGCLAKGFAIAPHGIDFVPELVELARARHPAHRDSFEVANVWDWEPRRRYDYVRLSVEIVRPEDRAELVRRTLERAVAPGGRLILSHYRSEGEEPIDVRGLLEDLGLRVAGTGRAPGVELAWTDR